MIAFPLLIILLIFSFIIYLYKYSQYKPKHFPPGPPRLPIWGSYWFLLKENYNFLHKSFYMYAKKYKTDILGLYLGNIPTVVTLSNDLCKELLIRDEFIGRNDTIITRTRAFGKRIGIFFSDGEFWKQQRRFSLRYMRDYGFGRRCIEMENLMEHEIKKLIDLFTSDPKACDLDICRKKGEVLMPDVFTGPFLNAILLSLSCRSFEHHKLRVIAKADLKFIRSGDVTGNALSITPWLRFISPGFFGYTNAKEGHEVLLHFLKEIVEEHKKTYLEDHHRDFIDVCLSEIKKLEEDNSDVTTFSEELEEQLLLLVLDYMFPAPIGPVHTLNFYFGHMINNPDIQSKVQNEIDRVVGRSRLPNLDDRRLLPYTEATLREALRISPITPLGIGRRCIEDTWLGGYFIPKDTVMLPCLWTAHRDTSLWKNPDEFKPERFLDDEGNQLKKDYTIGFGAGKRLCAGETFARQNMFLIIAGLMQNFTFKVAAGEKIPNPEKDLIPGLTLSLRDQWVEAVQR